MTRPASGEWAPLDLDEDPVPGDPAALTQLRTAYQDLASTTREAFQLLTSGSSIEGGQGKAMVAYRELLGEVPRRLDVMANSYGQAAEAYARYQPALEEAQSMSLNALNQARQASQDKAAATASAAVAQAALAAATGDAATLAQDDVTAAEGKGSAAQQELDQAKSLLNQAIAMRDQAAASARDVLDSLADDAPQRSIWEKIGDAFRDFFEFLISTVTEWIVTILDVLATLASFIFPPLGMAIGLLASGIEIASAALKGDMAALGIALAGLALGFIPGGKLMKHAIKLGKGLGGSVKSGIGNAISSVGGGAGRNIGGKIPPPKAVQPPPVNKGIRGANVPARANSQPKKDVKAIIDPIEVATGRMVAPQTDLELAGSLPLVFTRTHLSSYRIGRWFGPSWSSTLDQRIEVDEQGVSFAAEDATMLDYPDPGDGVVFPHEGPRWPLTRTDDGGYAIMVPEDERLLYFAPSDHSAHPISAVLSGSGDRIDFRYDEDGTITGISHTGGYELTVGTHEGLVTDLRLADGTLVAEYRYEGDKLVEVVTPEGEPLRFSYDDAGRIVRWEDRNGMWYEYVYDSQDRCVETRGAGGYLSATFEYTDLVTRVTDSLGHTKTFHMNDAFQVVREIDPLGGVIECEWDRYDRLLTRTDQLGNTTRYVYDEEGNLLTVTAPDGTETLTEYLSPTRPTRRIEPDGAEWRYDYDSRWNLIAATDPTGARTTFTHDEAGRPITVTDAIGAVTQIEYNPAGLPVQITDPLGARNAYTYDAFGRIATVTSPLGEVTRLSWAENGEIAKIVEPDGSVRRWTFDGEGNLRESVDAQGEVTRAEIGHFDLPVAEIAPQTGRTEYAYDTELRLTSVTNARGETWRYEYDAAGNLVREIDFGNRELRYTVDSAGRMVERTNASGQTVQIAWDENGRLAQVGDTTYSYDAAGRLVRAVSPHADLAMTYDALGRVLSETVNGRTVTNGYDLAGRRIRRRTPSGAESGWTYNEAGQPTALHVAGRIIKFGYDVAGREIGRSVGGLRVAQRWDAGGRISSQMVFNGSPGALQSRKYTYREDGTLTSVDDLLRGVRQYEVDGPGRVTGVFGENWTERYSYDEAGTLVNDTSDRDYDADGRLVQRREGQRVWRYKWDGLDRLIAVITPEREHWQYHYDGLGRRIAKQRVTMDGVEIIERIEFAWDGTEIVEESANGTVTVWDWQPGAYQPISQVERSGDQEWTDARFRAIVTDLVGMPTELVDEHGHIRWTANNTLWGNGIDTVDGTPLRFPGQYHDEETGLYYNFHRYYDPAIGRYVSNDPLGLAPALDPHGYVLNPTALIDPLGLAPCGTDKFRGMKTDVNLRPDGTITSVKVKGRPPTNVRGKQGDHGTPFVSMTHMGENAVKNKTPAQAILAQRDLLTRLQQYPGFTKPPQNMRGEFDRVADEINNDIDNVVRSGNVSPNDVARINNRLLDLRNNFNFTAVGNKTSTGGHNEAGIAGALQQGETILGSGKNLPANHGLLDKPWAMFDAKGMGNKLNTDVLRQHMMSMQDAYPKLFGPGGQFSRSDLIDQLERTNQVPANMIKELRDDPVPGSPQLGDKRPGDAEGSIADGVKRRRRAD